MTHQAPHQEPPQPSSERRLTIFELLSEYHQSLESMRLWLETADLDDAERIGIADAWQDEMAEWFHQNGYCFGCNRPLERCGCPPDA